MKKIVVFGALGNIGKYLLDYFVNKCNGEYQIIGVDRIPNTDFEINCQMIQMDIDNSDDYAKLPAEDVYAVIDLVGPMPAAMEGYDPMQYINTNVLGSYRVFDYAVRIKADRILYAKSFCDILKRSETDPFLRVDDTPYFDYDNHHSVYCVTQNTALELLKCTHEFYGIKTFVFRLPHIYLWKKDDTYNVKGVPHKMMHRILIDNAIAGKPLEVWGDHTRKKDMIYVKDLCQMFYKACFVDKDSGFYNVGTGVGISLLDQIKGIRDVFGEEKKSELIFCPEKPNAPQYIMDIREAVDELDYHPSYSYLDMLIDMKKEMKIGRY